MPTFPNLTAEVAKSTGKPPRLGARDRVILGSVKDYVDASASTLPADSVTLGELAPGVKPSHVVKFAGRFTTLGGDATETITVTGALATDEVVVTLRQVGAVPRTILTAATSSNTVTVVFSGDPSTDHVLTYQVLRAAT